MVEYARTRLALLWEIAMNEHRRNVMPPTSMTMMEGGAHTSMIGESLTSRNTPCLHHSRRMQKRRGGVGATIARRSHVEGHLRGLGDAGRTRGA